MVLKRFMVVLLRTAGSAGQLKVAEVYPIPAIIQQLNAAVGDRFPLPALRHSGSLLSLSSLLPNPIFWRTTVHRKTIILATLLSMTLLASPLTALADEHLPIAEPAQQADPQLVLQQENALLREKLRSLECLPTLTAAGLNQKKLQRMQELAKELKAQRQSMTEFEGFVRWMTANLSGYEKYIQAGSVAAGFAKVLPIPYAGQASVLTKFVSQGVLSLNAASVSINRYLGSSQQFITRVDGLPVASPAREKELAELSRLADDRLLKDTADVQQKLTMTSEVSSSTLSFLESLYHYAGSGEEYWNKTKSLVGRGDADKKEKGFLSENINGLKGRAAAFNTRLKGFDESARKTAPAIKSLATYDELSRELESRASATAKGENVPGA
jgi:hypothetical protein